MIELF